MINLPMKKQNFKAILFWACGGILPAIAYIAGGTWTEILIVAVVSNVLYHFFFGIFMDFDTDELIDYYPFVRWFKFTGDEE